MSTLAHGQSVPTRFRRHEASNSVDRFLERPLTAPSRTDSHPLPAAPPFLPPIMIPAIEETVDSSEISISPSKRPRLQHKSFSIHTSNAICLTRQNSVLRPLPPVPSSAPLLQPSHSPATPKTPTRPLPHPPTSPLPSITVSAPPTPSVAARSFALSRPSLPLLHVDTSDTTLRPPSSNEVSLISPLTPVVPSPNTLKRKRMAKLRRHLGESFPQELVFGAKEGVVVTTNMRLDVAGLKCGLAFESDEAESDSDDEKETEEEALITRQVQEKLGVMDSPVGTFHPCIIKRYSRKWIREKGGRRWVENDFQDILRALREL